jgi:phosphoribosyl 1,2-cyclic phosphodiesterase
MGNSRMKVNSPVQCMRIHLYGTQGCGSVFPSREERHDLQHRVAIGLLKLVFEDLSQRADQLGHISRTVEEILGGPVSHKTLTAYAERFDVPEPPLYGGWTTCVRVEIADGHEIVFDCGSGFRHCSRDLQAKWAGQTERHLYLFGSHGHLDHTEGFDQAAVCFDPRNHLHIYGNHQFLRALDVNLAMPAKFERCAIGAAPPEEAGRPSLEYAMHPLDAPIVVGATTITAFEVFHPAPCLAYRVEHSGRVFVFCTDHELWHGDLGYPSAARSLEAEARVIKHATDADLLYRDGQYLRAEYDGLMGIGGCAAVSRAGWGHSCIEDIIEMAAECRVRHTLIGHHDPNRDWLERNWLDAAVVRRTRGGVNRVEFARAETVFDL